MRTVATTALALLIAWLTAAAQTPQKEMVEVTRTGCLKAWQPGPVDATRTPEIPKTGIYVLTPINVDPSKASVDSSSYVLLGGTANFSIHVNHKVEITGVEQPAQVPDNKLDAKSMPSLTVKTLKMVSQTCA
jgi:hypothetical protein